MAPILHFLSFLLFWGICAAGTTQTNGGLFLVSSRTRIAIFNPNTYRFTWSPVNTIGLGNITDMVYDPIKGHAYVTINQGLYEVDILTGSLEVIRETGDIYTIALDYKERQLFYLSRNIVKINIDTNATDIVKCPSMAILDPRSLMVDMENKWLYWNSYIGCMGGGLSYLYRMSYDCRVIELVHRTGITGFMLPQLDIFGTDLYWADFGPSLKRLDLHHGNITFTIQSLVHSYYPSAMVVTSQGIFAFENDMNSAGKMYHYTLEGSLMSDTINTGELESPVRFAYTLLPNNRRSNCTIV